MNNLIQDLLSGTGNSELNFSLKTNGQVVSGSIKVAETKKAKKRRKQRKKEFEKRQKEMKESKSQPSQLDVIVSMLENQDKAIKGLKKKEF